MPDAPAPPKRKQRDGSAARSPRGRHHELDRVVRNDRAGQPVTVEQDALDRIATGIPLAQAAGGIGVRKQTIHEWRRRGVRARARQLAGETITDPDETRLIDFADRCDEAEARGYSTEWVRHGTVAAGGLEKVTVTTRTVTDGDGKTVTETVRRVETMLPDAKAIQWRLGVRYGATVREQLEVTGAGGGPLEVDVLDVRAAGLAERFGRFVDASATEVAPDLAPGGNGPRAELGGGVTSSPQGPPSPLAERMMDAPSPDADVPAPKD